MKIGIIRTSLKENERRVPIYPEHLPWIAPEICKRMIFETGYGRDFGFADDYFKQHKAAIASRDRLFKTCDLLILPRPVPQDVEQMRKQQVLWGWPHCVQQKSIAQPAIDRNLTLIAWEAMHQWSPRGERLMHIFYKNNEIAGYAAVLHVLELLGIDGHYGPRRKVAVIGYGSVSRGAIYALRGRGFNNIHVYSKRPMHLIADQNPDVYYNNILINEQDQIMVRQYDGSERPFIEELAEADIICNGILQNTDHPLIFVHEHQVTLLKPRSIIIDVSCDEGMGFSFARPTTFNEPTFSVGNNITYYSVDHTPSYLWNAASREISRALIPYLPVIAGGEDSWKKQETLRRAIEIKDGVIKNPRILSFQHRRPKYPHEII